MSDDKAATFQVRAHDDITRAAWDKEVKVLMSYAVSVSLNRTVLGSGTLVSVGANKGILTAAHVADKMTDAEHEVSLIVSFDQHIVKTPPESSWVELYRRRGSNERLGPDIAFLSLNPDLANTLSQRKSFYPLGRSLPPLYGSSAKHLTWTLIGTPAALSQTLVDDPQFDILHAENLVTFPNLVEAAERDEFDYLSLRVSAGVKDHPSDYGGVSGGSLWVAQVSYDSAVGSSSFQIGSPRLAGVVYYQEVPQDGESILLAHGPKSLELIVAKCGP